MSLVETMIATSLMATVVIGGLLSANYIGLRESQLVQSKAGASDTSRRMVNGLLTDIRLAKGFNIGNAAGTNFTACNPDTAQTGTAVMLYPVVNTTNQAVDTSQYILYYFDLRDATNNDGWLWRVYNVSGAAVATTVVASNLINSLNFKSEDFRGITQTNRTYKGVIHATLQFCEFQYPLTKVGSNYLYDYYRIDCRATPHLPDGP
jgi:hypothetical protein